MLYIIRDIIFIILAIIGLVQIARSVVLFFMRSKKDGDVIMVVPIHGHDEEAEIVLRHAAARVKWVSGGRFKKVVCLDCGMDDETKKICDTVCRDYEFMELMESPKK